LKLAPNHLFIVNCVGTYAVSPSLSNSAGRGFVGNISGDREWAIGGLYSRAGKAGAVVALTAEFDSATDAPPKGRKPREKIYEFAFGSNDNRFRRYGWPRPLC
jgi:hypothetical protein